MFAFVRSMSSIVLLCSYFSRVALSEAHCRVDDQDGDWGAPERPHAAVVSDTVAGSERGVCISTFFFFYSSGSSFSNDHRPIPIHRKEVSSSSCCTTIRELSSLVGRRWRSIRSRKRAKFPPAPKPWQFINNDALYKLFFFVFRDSWQRH